MNPTPFKHVDLPLYRLNQLPDPIQQRILERDGFYNIEHNEWWDGDCWLEPTKEQLEAAGVPEELHGAQVFKWKKICSFDIEGHRQHLAFEDLEVREEGFEVFRLLLGIPKWLWEQGDPRQPDWALDWSFKNSSKMYPTTKLELENPIFNEDEDFLESMGPEWWSDEREEPCYNQDQSEKVYRLIHRAMDRFDDLMDSAFRSLVAQYEYLCSEEALREAFEDRLYTIDGQFWEVKPITDEECKETL